jgi:hypothetical protein
MLSRLPEICQEPIAIFVIQQPDIHFQIFREAERGPNGILDVGVENAGRPFVPPQAVDGWRVRLDPKDDVAANRENH